MRVIKLYEEFGDELYHEISVEEWRDKFHDDSIDFVVDEFNWIRDYFKGWLVCGPYGEVLSGNIMVSTMNVRKKNRPDFNGFCILKKNDEWYYVCDKYSSTYYKCDTFEGAKQLFRDRFDQISYVVL